MIGRNVICELASPDETVKGELRQQNSEGVWIYHGFMEQGKLRFYPMHRVVRISDNGNVYR